MKTKIVILLLVLFAVIRLQVNAQSNLIRLRQIEPIPATILKAPGINTTYGLFPNGTGGVIWRAIQGTDIVGGVGTGGNGTITGVVGLQDSLLNRYTKPQAERQFYSASEAEDVTTNFYTKTEADSKYLPASNATEATTYFYTKAQVDAKLDSIYRLAVAYTGANPPPTTTTLGNNLISIWEFDETSGTTAVDAKGAHNATLYNGTLVNQTGKIGKCVTFDGVNDYARVASSVADFNNLTGPFSISVWVKTIVEPISAGHGIIFKGGEADPCAWAQFGIVADNSVEINGSNIRAINDGLIPDYLYPNADVHFPINEWHHIVVTYNKTTNTERFYVDGVQSSMQSVAGTGIVGTATSQLTFGSLGGTGYFNCSIDQVAIWNREINLAEVQSIYNNGNGKAYTSW